ncbi:carboxymuconolactone decarboxylase family protein [Jatrophihabitans sp. DSM 45814]
MTNTTETDTRETDTRETDTRETDNQEVVLPSERRARGRRVLEEVIGRPASEVLTAREETLLDFVMAEVWTRPNLGMRERRLVALTTLAGANSYRELERHIYGTLASGDLSRDELDEWVLHFAVYCGWGMAETADRMILDQWEQLHRDRGTTPPPRRSYDVTDEPEDQELRKQVGEREFLDVNWVPAPGRDLPYQGTGILPFVFGKMWRRPGLTRRDRRFITLACVAVSDSQIPIQAHVWGALRSGDVTLDEIREVVLQFAVYGGWPKGSYFQQVVEEQRVKLLLADVVGAKAE